MRGRWASLRRARPHLLRQPARAPRVYESHDVRMNSGFGDDRAAIQQDSSISPIAEPITSRLTVGRSKGADRAATARLARSIASPRKTSCATRSPKRPVTFSMAAFRGLNTGKVSRSQAAVRALKLQTKFPAGHVHRNRRNPTAARTTCWRARSVQFWG